jgi:hypothetical protein
MQVAENVVVVCRSLGEKNMVIVENENLGIKLNLENPKGIEIELGLEGRVIYKEGENNQLISFEPVMVEELV